MEKRKCEWCLSNELMTKYHDEQFGILKKDTNSLFKWFVLEGMQAGLSWQTIINKEAAYDQYFANFDVKKVSEMDVNYLLDNMHKTDIIKNKLKVQSIVSNAQLIIEIEKEQSFFDYLISLFDLQLSIEENINLIVKKLKKAKFKFVGYEIVKSFFESVGIIQAHLPYCDYNQEPYLKLK